MPVTPTIEIDGVKVPVRLKPDFKWMGPDFYGCINTGTRPTIIRRSVVDRYFVGPEMGAVEGWKEFVGGKSKNRRKFKVDGRFEVWAFKGRKAAVAKFVELCKAATAQNRKVRNEHEQALRNANSDDPQKRIEGAAALLDF